MRKFALILAACAMVAGAPQDDKDEVAAAAKKITEAENYSFKGTILLDLPSFGGGGGGGDEEPEPSKFEGEHGAEGSHVLTESQEIVKYKGKTITRPRSEWRVQDPNAEGGGRGGRGRGGRGFMGRMFSNNMKLPHEELAGLDDQIKDAEKTDKTKLIGETEGTLYKIEFTDEAAEGMFGSNRMLERLEDAEFTATGKFYIDADGNILSYEIEANLIGAFGANEFEIGITRTVTIFKVGDTKVKIPKKARKAAETSDDE